MSYKKEGRFDGRKPEEYRSMKMEVGILPNCTGSAKVSVGKTTAVAGVYGPKEVRPHHMTLNDKLLIRCYYDLISFSVPDRARPGPSRRSRELGLVIKNALEKSIFVEDYPQSMLEVFVEITQADAGTRCAGVVAASLAVADAGLRMRDLVPSIATGKIDDMVCLDLTKEEEDYHHGDGPTDIPIAYLPVEDEITLLQLDGKITKDELMQALKMGVDGCKRIHADMRKVFKERYER